MPLVEAVATIWLASPEAAAGASEVGEETLAGASIACVGTVVPSGRVAVVSPATAVPRPTPVRLAVHAAESTASGTMAVAFCSRVKDGMAAKSPLGIVRGTPSSACKALNEWCHSELRNETHVIAHTSREARIVARLGAPRQ